MNMLIEEEKPGEDPGSKRRLATASRTHQGNFQVKFLNNDIVISQVCLSLISHWLKLQDKSNGQDTCGSFEGGERMRFT